MNKNFDAQYAASECTQLWNNYGTYRFDSSQVDNAFIIDTPPPTVSGSLHIGHIFSYTHQDIIARYFRMRGKNVLYPFGFDDNGLPTERYVEQKQGISPLKLGKVAFTQAILEETALSRDQFRQLWQNMGLSIDWKFSYSTISPQTQKLSQASFIALYKKNAVYRELRPAPYCTTCFTSVAQAELEDASKPGVFYTLSFTHKEANDILPIATTRPEFLASCVALMVHPEDARYTKLVGSTAIVPLYNHQVPIIADELVHIDKGTGIVMCCAFGDATDIAWIEKHQLPYTQILQKNGTFLSHLTYIGGLKVNAAREAIIQALRTDGIIIAEKQIDHSTKVHERCKRPVEYLYLRQWFVKLLDKKDALLDAINLVEWHPSYMRHRAREWAENLGWDWCISRQRFYGIPFPCWHCQTCQHVIIASETSLPVDPTQMAYDSPCPHCGTKDSIIADTDVMDTWNTSSITPYLILDLIRQDAGADISFSLPLMLRPQAHDIIRTWAFYTIAKTTLLDNCIPWKDIIISGHVQAPGKEKISKSAGNNPYAPDVLLQQYHADAIRYWAASAQLGMDTQFSPNQLKIGQKLVTKLWNAFIFISEHADLRYAFTLTDKEPTDSINRWILQEMQKTVSEYHLTMHAYEFHKGLAIVEQFFWNHWCDTYLEIIKDRFYNSAAYTQNTILETRAILAQIGSYLLQLYAPFLPFITETLFQQHFANNEWKESVHKTLLPIVNPASDYQGDTAEAIIAIIQMVRKLKTSQQLSLKETLAFVTITVKNSTLLESLTQELPTIKGCIKAIAIIIEESNEISDSEQESFIEQQDSGWHVSLFI